MIAAILNIFSAIASWFIGRQADEHDAQVRAGQQTTDALKGESDALQQVDRDNAAVDGPGIVPIADDPNNLNR